MGFVRGGRWRAREMWQTTVREHFACNGRNDAFSCCDERFRKVFEAPRRIRRRLARLQYGRDGMAPGDGRGSGLAALTLPVQRLRRLGQLGAGAQADHRPHLLMKD